MDKKSKGIVYSTAAGRMCPSCARPVDRCVCGKPKDTRPGDGVVRVRRETKGRGGKTVTVVTGIPLGEEGIRDLATGLKQKLGTGGAVRENTIEIQGDHVERILSELAGRGFKAKRAGG
ncbi:MAG: translation initiation factor Sui1 [Candidatus Latescibacterota bacterium]